MKNLVYDISILGAGYGGSTSQAGIYRVVEHIAKELVKTDQIKLKFSSVVGINTLACSSEYLKENVQFYEGVPLLDLNSGVQKMMRNSLGFPHPKDASSSNLLKKALYDLNRLSLLFSYSAISPDSLSNIDSFHSPYFSIPHRIRKMPAIKKFITIYDLIPILFPQKFKWGLRCGYQKIIKSIDRETNIFCISEATKNDLCHYLPQVDPNKITVTYLAASEKFYPASIDQILEVRKKYHLPEGDYFLSLSTLEPRKNLDHLVHCFTKLMSEKQIGNDLNLVLAGSKGWLTTDLYKEISKSRYKNRIYLTGYIADEDLAAVYSGAIGFVYPSIYEGFGLPPLEAMQCGTPVITSNTSSLPEVVGDAGIMVSPRDTDALCQAMLTLYKKGEVRKKMSDQSIRRAKQFSWERCRKETLAAYQKAV